MSKKIAETRNAIAKLFNAYTKLSLLTSATAIAEFFANKKITGVVNDPNDCPIVNFFVSVLGEDYGVMAREGDIHVTFPVRNGLLQNEIFQFPMTLAMDNFVERFDARKFKKLIAPPAE